MLTNARCLVATFVMAMAAACFRDFDAPFSATADGGTQADGGVRDAGRRNDGSGGAEQDVVEVPPGCPPPIVLTSFDAPNAAWQLRGDAYRSDGGPNTIALVPVEFYKAGAAWWPSPLAIQKIIASFSYRSKGAGGYPAADGIVLAMVGADDGGVPGVGAVGGSLGFCTLGGFGVALDMLPSGATDPAPNVKVWAGKADGGLTCDVLAESPTIARMTDGNLHEIRVEWDVAKGAIEAFVDELTAVKTTLPALTLPSASYAGFTAASGGYRGELEVAAPAITVVPPCP